MPNPIRARAASIFWNAAAQFLFLVFCLMLLAAGAVAADAPAALPNGLQRVPDSRLKIAYARPGIDLKKYRTIQLRTLAIPAAVRNGKPNRQTTSFRESYVLRDKDVEDLQAAYAQVMRNILGKAGFTFVDSPQADTLVVAVQVVNISLNAPIESTRASYSGGGKTYSRGAGSMAIAALLADGDTGEVIAEAVDRKYPTNVWRINNRVTNLSDARTAFGFWARALRDRLSGAN